MLIIKRLWYMHPLSHACSERDSRHQALHDLIMNIFGVFVCMVARWLLTYLTTATFF